ncbi:MAG: ribosome silencing factor [Myxococcota bacterium]|nr:ribosome silencing factor [Myxococcota bacterium]
MREESIIDTQQLTKLVATCLLEKKGLDIVVLNIEGRVSYCDHLVLCTATSARQVRALADHVTRTLRALGRRPMGAEGLQTGHWALVDLGDVILHVFDRDSRQHYDLDGLWLDVPRLTLADLGISEADEAPEPEVASPA